MSDTSATPSDVLPSGADKQISRTPSASARFPLFFSIILCIASAVIAAALSVSVVLMWQDPALGPSDQVHIETKFSSQARKISQQGEKINALQAQLNIIGQNPPPGHIFEQTDAQIRDLSKRISALEEIPAQLPNVSKNARIAAQVTNHQTQINELMDELAQLRSMRTAHENNTEIQSLITGLNDALLYGDTPFEQPLNALAQMTGLPIPPDLANAAPVGVASMGMLQNTISDAARDALAAVRAQEDDAPTGVIVFLRRQFEVRSLVPREGSDPDAILSRVEFAVKNRDLTSALSQAQDLPDVARIAMASWLQACQTRVNARQAAQAFVRAALQ